VPIHLKVETELDQSSARRAADEVQNHFRNATRNIGTEFSQGLKSGIDDAVRGVSGSFGPLSSQAESVFGGMSSKAGLAALAVGGIGIAAGGALTELYNLGSQWDSIVDNITGKTGLVGTELDKVTESIKNVAVNSSADLGAIGDVAGSLTQSLHLTGKPLEDLTTRITDLNTLTGDKLNIRDLAKVFSGFKIEADKMPESLDQLYDVFTNTGIPVSELVATLKDIGPTARLISPDIGVAAGLLSTMEEAGINGETAFNGLKIAMGNLAKSEPGTDPKKAIEDVVTEMGNLIAKGDETGAIDMGKTTFGKSWQPIFDAIKNGKLTVDELNTSVQNTGHTIEGSKKATDDWSDEFKKMKNELQVELEPAAKVVFGAIGNMIHQYLIEPFHELNTLIGNITGAFHDLFGGGTPLTPGVPGVPAAPQLGPALSGQAPFGSAPGQNPLNVFAPTGGGGHPGPPQIGGGGSSLPGVQGAVYQGMLQSGFPASEWGALQNLLTGESGFRPTVRNSSSGAYGLFQFLGHENDKYGALGAYSADPGAQTQAGMQYIKDRYGTPSAAYQFWLSQSPHWYDEGGWLQPGVTIAQNTTGQPEAVLNPQQSEMLGSFFGGMQQGGGIGGIVGGIGNLAMNAAQSSVQPGMQPTGKGGGSSQGGAGGALGMAAGMLPGGQVAAALAMRTAKFAGQLASIGIMGAMETWLPGGTELSDPSKSLLGRVASGIAGGQPASKNMAGQAPPPQAPPPPGSPASGRGSGPLPGPAPMVVMNQPIFQNGTDGEAVARDIARQQASYTAGDNRR